MLIRSQDKKRITTDLNLEILHESWDSEEWEIGNNAVGVIGNYSTEQKAIKVLDMIENAYLNCNHSSMMCNYAFVENNVFQMPQDEEV